MIDLTGSRILITGGAGFMGSHVADQLLDLGVGEIVLLDNMIRGHQRNIQSVLASGRATLVQGDIRDLAVLDRCMEGADFCLHLAALRITRCRDNPREALEVMYNGWFNVLEACVKHNIGRLVAASSASIYGLADTFPTAESHPPYNNVTLYGAGKAAGELMCRSFHDMYGLDYVALRYFNIYGPRMDTEGKYTEVLVRWYDLIRRGERPRIFGLGDQTLDMIYIEDVARANVQALRSDHTTDRVFNVASGEETSLRQVCEGLLTAMGSELEPELIPLPAERKGVEVTRRLAEVSAAREHIAFEATTPLDQGLSRLVGWLDAQDVKVL